MRIISGKFKGRRFYPPADNWPTRPTTDFAKEGLFNILTNNFDFEDIKVLDLFGGTGNHTYEFISRGCLDVTYVDKHAPAVRFVRETTKKLEIEDNLRIIQGDVFKFISAAYEQFDYIFAGPPYGLAGLDSIPDKIFEKKLAIKKKISLIVPVIRVLSHALPANVLSLKMMQSLKLKCLTKVALLDTNIRVVNGYWCISYWLLVIRITNTPVTNILITNNKIKWK